MTALQQQDAGFVLQGRPPESVQPGGGACLAIELAWGRLRRRYLRLVRPGHLRSMLALRRGDCPHCPHDIIDPRDLKFTRNVCGYLFRPADDRFAWAGRLVMRRPRPSELG